MFSNKGAAPMNAASNVAPISRNVVKLQKAITTHKGSTNSLEFAEPTASLFIRHKRLPFSVKTSADGSQSVDVDFALAAAYICDLVPGVDEHILGQLSPADFGACMNKLTELLNAAGN
jgi:hypothetical protein